MSRSTLEDAAPLTTLFEETVSCDPYLPPLTPDHTASVAFANDVSL